MDFKKEIEERIENIYWDLYKVKKNKNLFLEDIEAIAISKNVSQEEVISTFNALYLETRDFLQFYKNIKGLKNEIFCFRILDRINNLHKEFYNFFYNSEYFLTEKGGGGETEKYFNEIRRWPETFNLLYLFKNFEEITLIFEEIVETNLKAEIQDFNIIEEAIVDKLFILMAVLETVISLKPGKLKLSEIRHRQLISKNGIPVEILKNVPGPKRITGVREGMGVLCIGGVYSLAEMKEQKKENDYSFLNKVSEVLIPEETPIGKEATLFYRIENCKSLINRLESARRAFEKLRKSNIVVEIEKLKEQIKPEGFTGYIIQVEVLKSQLGKGYAKALVDTANFEIFSNDGADVIYTIVESDNPDGKKMMAVFEKEGFIFIKDIYQIDYDIEWVATKYNIGIKFKNKNSEFESIIRRIEGFLFHSK